MSDSERRYSDDEARRIIKRALQLQHRQMENEAPTEGVSLSDLESIATDVGVSRELLRRAAEEVESGEANRARSKFIGSTTSPTERLELAHPVSDEDLQELLAALPSMTGEEGTGNSHRASLSWSTSAVTAMRTGRVLHVSVRGAKDRAVVRIRDDLGQMAAGLFGGLLGGVGLGGGLGVGLGVGIGALGSPLFATIVPLAFLGGSYLLARTVFRLVSRRRRREVGRIAERIREFLEADLGGARPSDALPDGRSPGL